MKTSLFCPAKINTSLSIHRFLLSENKHSIESVMHKISLADRITIQLIKGKTKITLSGKYTKNVPCSAEHNEENNIVFKAIAFFYHENPFLQKKSFHIHIEKNIPNQAGLGGGSSNAASVIKHLHHTHKIPLVPSLYKELGSDIPFFLEDYSSAMVSGVGEKVTPYFTEKEKSKNKYGILIFPQDIEVSTQWAFHNWNNKKGTEISLHKNLCSNSFIPLLCNTFPQITKLLERVAQFSPAQFGISGSGSTIFALFDKRASQEECLSSNQLRGNIITKFTKL